MVLGGCDYNSGRDLLSLPGISAGALENTVRRRWDTIRDGVSSAARETSAEVKERAPAGVDTAVNRA